MSDQPHEEIKVSKEELSAAWVDESLAQINAAQTAQRQLPDVEPRLIYRSWFALLIAGGLAALLAWMVVESLFTDYAHLKGNVQSYRAWTYEGEDIDILTVGGNDVLIGKEFSQVMNAYGEQVFVRDIPNGSVLDVYGQIYCSAGYCNVTAYQVEWHPEDRSSYASTDLNPAYTRQLIGGLLLFPLPAALIGMAIGATDGLLSRHARRARKSGRVGLITGFGFGIVALILAGLIYNTGSQLIYDDSTREITLNQFILQMINRGLAWAVAGIGAGLGQGIALRSKKLLLNGLIGGLVGGLIGGLFFDPISYVLTGGDFFSLHNAAPSRAIGLLMVGLMTGLMIGLVETWSREAWLKMLVGPRVGKEFILYNSPYQLGSASDANLFIPRDLAVEGIHAIIRRAGDHYEIEDQDTREGTFVNGHPIHQRRLQNGDQIELGQVVMLFSQPE